MNTTLKLGNADALQATLTITATIGEFKRLREQLATAERAWVWPLSDVQDSLAKVISQADQSFEASATPPETTPAQA